MEKITNIFKNDKMAYFVSILFSVLLFLAIYGIQPLNIFNTSWLDRYDIVQKQFINWASFRNDEWSFPLVTAHTDFMVEGRVVLWDIIPLFAIICKLISPLSPSSFQYFGIWALINTALFGFFSVKLFKRFIENNIKVVVASALLLVLTLLMGRLYIFTPLNAQWIVLLCLLILKKCIDNQIEDKELLIKILVITLVASFIHIYFSLICISFSIGIAVYRIIIQSDKRITGILVFGCIFISFIIAQIMSGNMFAIFEGRKVVYLIPSISMFYTQKDLYNIYIGIGDIVIICYAVHLFFSNIKNKDRLITNWRKIVPLLVLLIVIAFLVVFPFEVQISKNDTSLVSAYKNIVVSLIISLFISYIGILAAIVYVVKTQPTKNIFLILAIVMSLEFDNIGAFLQDSFWIAEKTSVDFDEEIWADIAENQKIKKVVMLYSVPKENDIWRWAVENGKAINGFERSAVAEETIDELLEDADETSLFIIDRDNQSISYWKYDNLNYYWVDDYVIAYSKRIDGIDSVPVLDLITRKYDMNNNFYTGGKIENGVKILFPEGESYGPYCALPTGLYEVKIKGNNLKNNVSINIYSDTASEIYGYSFIKKEYDKIVLQVRFDEDVDSLQFIIDNNSEKEVQLNYIKITPLEIIKYNGEGSDKNENKQ